MRTQHAGLTATRTSPLRDFLPPLAAAFSFPHQNFEEIFSTKMYGILSAGEYAVSVVFRDIRAFLGLGQGHAPDEVASLAGVVGTSITLLEALYAMSTQKNMDAATCEKLSALLVEYKKLFEDIELFSGDITAEDCFTASCASGALSGWNRQEEDAAWQNL